MKNSIARQSAQGFSGAVLAQSAALRSAPERSTEIFSQALEKFVLRKRFRRPRRPKRSKTWQTFVELGIDGWLAWLINDHATLHHWSLGRRGRRSVPSGVQILTALYMRRGLPSNTGSALRKVLDTSGWRMLQVSLLWLFGPDATFLAKDSAIWRQALSESLILGHLEFELTWCNHGEHWYFSDRAGRKDCTRHRLGGQAYRYRAKVEAARRKTARLQAAKGAKLNKRREGS